MSASFNQTGRVRDNPTLAPSARLTPDQTPKPHIVKSTLEAAGIDPDDLAGLLQTVADRGWVWRIGGGGRHASGRNWAAIVVPWVDRNSTWSDCWGNGLTQALAAALTVAMLNPPPEEGDVDSNFLAEHGVLADVTH